MGKNIIGLRNKENSFKKQIIKKISSNDIAVIGISCKLPGCDDVDDLWRKLELGTNFVTDIPEKRRKDIDEFLGSTKLFDVESIKYGKASYLDRIDEFDNEMFGLSPSEATLIDPNQRIFTEVAYKALEDAGYGGKKANGSRTGVYLAYNSQKGKDYENFLEKIGCSTDEISYAGNVPAMISSRISYHLNLMGPSLIVDTACSSSLVALHLACQGLITNDCEMAIAGGITINFLPLDIDRKMGIESSDGITRTFDNSSDGTGTGEGVVAILLKPLSKALEDRDHVYAVIKGSAINQDGNSIGITAPNPKAQEDLIIKAWKNAGVNPETIFYIEAHGTGTRLGDPIEIDGITRAFKANTTRKQFCGIGSIKSNFGHLDVTAGLAGVLKVILAMNKKVIPPTINFNCPNMEIDFEQSPVYVWDEARKWRVEGVPRRAGVSAFGLSGTNAHVVLEELDEENLENYGQNIDNQLDMLFLSGKNKESLFELIKRYNKFLSNNGSLSLSDICYTASTGRGHYEYRVAIISRSIEELRNQLKNICESEQLKYESDTYFYGTHKIVSKNRNKNIGDFYQEEMRNFNAILKEKVTEFKDGKNNNMNLAKQICEMYIMGADSEWEILYREQNRKRISLPTYVYKKNRCWPKISEDLNYTSKDEDVYLNLVWEKKDDGGVREYSDKNYECVVIFKNETKLSQDIANSIKSKEIITIDVCYRFEKLNNSYYKISNKFEDYITLAYELSEKKITQIFHLATITNDEYEINTVDDLNCSLNYGVYSLLYLVKAFSKLNISNTELIVISNNINKIDDGDNTNMPEKAAMIGLLKNINIECQQYNCRSIDIDKKTSIETIINEIYSNSKEFQVGYRENNRYIQCLNKLELEDMPKEKLNFSKNGAYVITGGAGGVGLEISKHIASKENVNFIFIGRSTLPERSEWNKILEAQEGSKLENVISNIKKIEAMGSNVTYFNGDVSNETRLNEILERVRFLYGRVNGIIHCAGIEKENLVLDKNFEEFNEVVSSKIAGTWLLDHLTEKDNPDFFIMCSSAITLFNIRGQSDYVAANSYLDGYSTFRKGKKTLTVNWPGWKEVGLRIKENQILENNHSGLFKYISNKQAIKVFEKISNKKLSHVCVGEINEIDEQFIDLALKHLNFILSDNVKKEIYNKKKVSINQDVPKLGQAKVVGRGNGEYTKTELEIANIWANIFGYDEIDINDDFFEIGGHSLFAIKLEAEMKKNNFSIEDFDVYNYSTIKEMADYIKKGEI